MLLKRVNSNEFPFNFRPELKPVEKEIEVVLKFPEVEPLNPPVLTLNEIAFKYSPEKVIFTCVNLSANLDSRICIVRILYFVFFSFLEKLKHFANGIWHIFSRSVKTERVKRRY